MQAQILALQNNPPNIQRIGIVGYGPSIFYKYPEKDLEDFLREFRRYVIGSQINVATGVSQAPERTKALGLLISCLEEPAKL